VRPAAVPAPAIAALPPARRLPGLVQRQSQPGPSAPPATAGPAIAGPVPAGPAPESAAPVSVPDLPGSAGTALAAADVPTAAPPAESRPAVRPLTAVLTSTAPTVHRYARPEPAAPAAAAAAGPASAPAAGPSIVDSPFRRPIQRAAAAAPAAPQPAYDPGQVAVAAGLATRAADNSVVFTPPPSAGGSVPHIARQAAAAPSPAAAPPAAAAPAPGGTDRVAPDLAEMADALYSRIESRLRTDLLLERERRGALPDY
jgi:hypothetical protein